MHTTKDWIDRTRATDDPAERARCLREAEAVVSYPSDWNSIAEAWCLLGPVGHSEVRRCLEQALTLAGTDVFVYRNAAEVFIRELADREWARVALDLCRDAFVADATTRVSRWCHLGEVYVTVFADRVAGRECLDAGLAAARAKGLSIIDLCDLGGAFASALGDRATALTLITEGVRRAHAQTSDPDSDGEWWTLANAHMNALDDRAGAWRMLEVGLAMSDTVKRCLRMTNAVASQADPSRRQMLLESLAKAELLASSAEDWLAVGEASREYEAGKETVRRCLERALAADVDGRERAQIAHGFRHWLGDPETADRVAPRGVSPAALVVMHRRLEGWGAEPARLLDLLSARLGAKSVKAIAGCDYGHDYDTHLATLQDILSTGLIPQPLRWHPREVLELTRWTEGAKTDHVARAFACCVLCIDGAGPDYHDGLEQTIAVLIESCIELGAEAHDAAIGLMVVLCEAMEDYRGELVFAYLGLLVAAAAKGPDDPRLRALAELVITTADRLGADRLPRPEWGWLLGTTYFDQRHRLWRRLVRDTLVGPPHLCEIAARLAPT